MSGSYGQHGGRLRSRSFGPALLLILALVVQSGCITLPPDVAAELEPAPQDRPNHFHKRVPS